MCKNLCFSFLLSFVRSFFSLLILCFTHIWVLSILSQKLFQIVCENYKYLSSLSNSFAWNRLSIDFKKQNFCLSSDSWHKHRTNLWFKRALENKYIRKQQFGLDFSLLNFFLLSYDWLSNSLSFRLQIHYKWVFFVDVKFGVVRIFCSMQVEIKFSSGKFIAKHYAIVINSSSLLS